MHRKTSAVANMRIASKSSRIVALGRKTRDDAGRLEGATVLTAFENVIVVLVCTLSAVLFLWILNRFWPSSRRSQHNDIIGWQVGVLGTTYAVILGFMLYAVWTSYQDADINAEAEANCLVSVYRLADGLPAAQRDLVHQLARQYANTVIDEEWPVMHEGDLSLSGHNIVNELWTAVLQAKPATFGEQTSMNLTLAEISTMTEHRRVRQLESQSKLPSILWMVLIVGGGITTLSSCLFGIENFKLHCIQVFSLALMLSLILVAIADIDRPFRGTVHIEPRGFERARSTFAQNP
jgi:hypothetical protein